MKIRIAVAVDPDGDWNAAGWGGKKPVPDDEKMQIAVEPLGTGEARYFIEADVELPKPTPTVQGSVTPAT